MVDVFTDDWQQIEEAGLDRVDPLCIFRQPRCKVGEPLRLERGIDDDASAVAKNRA